MIAAAAPRLAAALLFLLVLPSSAAPIQIALDAAAVADAVRTARSGDPAALAAFHAGYRIPVDDAVVREVEIVSEFRRIVLLTEQHASDATWDAGRASTAAGPFRGLVDLVVRLQFSPQNSYRAMPPYSVVIHGRAAAGDTVRPVDSRASQAYVGGQPAPPGTPILAATLTATFDAARLDPAGRYLVGILLDGREVRRVPVDLGRVR